MAQYTVLTKHEIESILVHYNIRRISSFKVLSGGSENTNFLIKADSGKYVLTICEQKTEEKARQLVNVLEYLKTHRFETSEVIRDTKNEPILLWNGKPIMIKKFIEGKIREDLPDDVLESLGQQLGKLHKIEAPKYLPKKVNYGKEQFAIVEQYAANSHFNLWLKTKLKSITPYFSANLPKAFIHSDVFSDNVIIKEDENSVVIMDFEEATYYYRLFDVGMTIIGTCDEKDIINLEKVRSLLNGYRQEILLLDIEIEALQSFTVYAGAAMTFWRHSNFNYIKPDPRLSDHYLGLKDLTDYIEAQPVDYFLNQVISED